MHFLETDYYVADDQKGIPDNIDKIKIFYPNGLTEHGRRNIKHKM